MTYWFRRVTVGTAVVVGSTDRETNQVVAKAVESTDEDTPQGFVKDWADLRVTVYTDDAGTHDSLAHLHAAVKHSVSEYVRGQAHTDGVASFWSMLKCGYYGT